VIALLDIGGTKIAASVGRDAAIGTVRREPTPSASPLTALRGLIETVMEGKLPEAIAISAPGPFERDRGVLLNPPGMPASWHGLDLAHALGQRFDCPVVVENDANCAALAEARLGAGAGSRTVAYWTVSTGIGSGIVQDGRLVVGRHDTEGGHMVLWPGWLGGPPCHCGGVGCLEALASGRAIARRYGVAAEHLTEPEAWVEVGRWIGLAHGQRDRAARSGCGRLRRRGLAPTGNGSRRRCWRRSSDTCACSPGRRSCSATSGEERSLLGALLVAEDGIREAAVPPATR